MLVDRRAPGRETSFGNAGIIQSESVRPYAFPRRFAAFMRAAGNRSLPVRYDMRALAGFALPLAEYWWHSSPRRYADISADYARLILVAAAEHDDLLAASGAGYLIERRGWMKFYRRRDSWLLGRADATRITDGFGIPHRTFDTQGFRSIEPDMNVDIAGGIHWPHSPTVSDPGALTDAYVKLFLELGGGFETGDAMSLRNEAGRWLVATERGQRAGRSVVISLGPWSGQLASRLGYRFPLFVKRGYHMHYNSHDAELHNWVLDADNGYLVAPMRGSLRLTTGAEFAPLNTPPSPRQLDGCEEVFRGIYPLGERLEPHPWLGARPCTPDMKPIVGAAPGRNDLWFSFGHAHHGLTLAPATGRLLAELIVGEAPFVAPAAYDPKRFL